MAYLSAVWSYFDLGARALFAKPSYDLSAYFLLYAPRP